MIVLDLGLPGLDGLDVLKAVRRASGVPIIVVTGRDEEIDKLSGFDAGADDYMVKPYSLPELAARVRAVLRRGDAGLSLDPARGRRPGDRHRRPRRSRSTVTRSSSRARSSPSSPSSPPRPGDASGATSCSTTSGDRPPTGRTARRSPSTSGACARRSTRDPGEPRFIETVRGHGYRFVAAAR